MRKLRKGERVEEGVSERERDGTEGEAGEGRLGRGDRVVQLLIV